MIPYFKLSTLHLGPIPLEPWGMLVFASLVVGTLTCRHFAKQRNLDPDLYSELIVYLAVGILVFGHLGHALFYEPRHYFTHPIEFLYVWDGLSSFGGFFGCTLISIYFFRFKKVEVAKFVDVLLTGVLLGWIVGRLGCFVVHDHIGRPVASAPGWVQSGLGWLAIPFPDGAAGKGVVAALRWDLGFGDMLITIIVFATIMTLWRKPRVPGFIGAMSAILYGSMRFWLDFLRNTDLSGADTRYLGLTPGQYSSVFIVALGLFMIWRARDKEPWP